MLVTIGTKKKEQSVYKILEDKLGLPMEEAILLLTFCNKHV